MQAATQYGLTTALTRAALYDMWINQGDDTLVTQTNSALGTSVGGYRRWQRGHRGPVAAEVHRAAL